MCVCMHVQIDVYACIKPCTCIRVSNIGVFMYTKGVYACIDIYVPVTFFFFKANQLTVTCSINTGDYRSLECCKL